MQQFILSPRQFLQAKGWLLACLFAVSFLVSLSTPQRAFAVTQDQPCDNDQNRCDTGLACSPSTGTCRPDSEVYGENPELVYANNWESTYSKLWFLKPKEVHEQSLIGSFNMDQWFQGAYTAGANSISQLAMGFSSPEIAAQAGAGSADAGGAIGSFGNLIADMTSTRPISTAAYVADLGQSLGFVTPAYAQDQGTGFKALEPILPLWKAFRNLAYFGFVIIFVVIGFMIMFRRQINPQTVITVQAALPKIVITLLLITFSYAIASFVVDLIYLLIYLIIGVFSSFGIIADAGVARKAMLSKNLLEIAFSDLLGPFQTGAAGIASGAVNEVVTDIIGKIGGTLANIVTGPLAYVIFAVAILISIFKLFFQLLLAYIGIIFGVILAPVTLLFNALPGNNGFFNWLKGILANALIFPVTATMFLIAGALIGGGTLGTDPNIGYGAYDYAETQLPLVGTGLSTEALTALIGIGFIMMMPKVIEMVQKMMGIEGGFAGMAAGALQPIRGVGGTIGHKLFGAAPEEDYKTPGLLRGGPLPGTERLVEGGVKVPKWSKYLDPTRYGGR